MNTFEKFLDIAGKLVSTSEITPEAIAAIQAIDKVPARKSVTVEIPVIKVDKEKRIVVGVVAEPDVPDAHGNYMRKETVAKAAHSFLAKYNRRSQLGLQHQIFGNLGLELVESYVAPTDMKIGDEEVREGSWVMAVKVLDDKLWEGVKDGTWTGFSYRGTATVWKRPADQ